MYMQSQDFLLFFLTYLCAVKQPLLLFTLGKSPEPEFRGLYQLASELLSCFFSGVGAPLLLIETGNCKEKFIDKLDPKTYD